MVLINETILRVNRVLFANMLLKSYKWFCFWMLERCCFLSISAKWKMLQRKPNFDLRVLWNRPKLTKLLCMQQPRLFWKRQQLRNSYCCLKLLKRTATTGVESSRDDGVPYLLTTPIFYVNAGNDIWFIQVHREFYALWFITL